MRFGPAHVRPPPPTPTPAVSTQPVRCTQPGPTRPRSTLARRSVAPATITSAPRTLPTSGPGCTPSRPLRDGSDRSRASRSTQWTRTPAKMGPQRRPRRFPGQTAGEDLDNSGVSHSNRRREQGGVLVLFYDGMASGYRGYLNPPLLQCLGLGIRSRTFPIYYIDYIPGTSHLSGLSVGRPVQIVPSLRNSR